jgi:hypothetical protein
VKSTLDKDNSSDSDDSDMDIINDVLNEGNDDEDDEDGDTFDANRKPISKPKPAPMQRGVSMRSGSLFYGAQSAAMLYSAVQGGHGGGLARSVSEKFGGTSSAAKKGTLPAHNTIFDAFAKGVPVSRTTRTAEPPVWLLGSSALLKTPPQMRFDSLGMHILDYGFGPHALLTVRELDDEMQPGHTLEQKSRTGVLGRIVSGVWAKLAEVCIMQYAISYIVCE